MIPQKKIMRSINVSDFEPRRNTKKDVFPSIKTNPFKTLRDKNKLLKRDKMAEEKLSSNDKEPKKPRRVKVSHSDQDNDLKTESSLETTTYRYIPKRTYPTYKGTNNGRGGFNGRGREKQKFKIHTEFHEDWLKYPNKDEEDEMIKYTPTSTQKQNIDWYAESATEMVTNEVPFELMKDKSRASINSRRNGPNKSGGRKRNNVDKHEKLTSKLSEDTTTSSINFATVFQPEIGLTSLFDLGPIKKKERTKTSSKGTSPHTQTPNAEESTETDTFFFAKKSTSSKPSTTLTFAVEKAGVPKPKMVGVKVTKNKPRVKMTKKIPKKQVESQLDATAFDKLDKGAIVEVNRIRVLAPTEGSLTPFVKPTTTSPISPQRKAAIHRRLDRYSSQLGKKSKYDATTTTTTKSTISSHTSSKNRRLPSRQIERDSRHPSANGKNRNPIKSRG